jgi:hypothetical protein
MIIKFTTYYSDGSEKVTIREREEDCTPWEAFFWEQHKHGKGPWSRDNTISERLDEF